jgi:hypothetical protein
MSHNLEITILLIFILAITTIMIFKAIQSDNPIGQRGIKGTKLANNKKLRIFHIFCLLILELSCIFGILVLWI